MSLGTRLKMLRKQMGFSQERLGDLVDAHVNTVRRWENGSRSPDTEMLQKLAQALNTTTGYLLGETDDPAKPAAVRAPAPELPESNVRLLSERIVEIPVYPISACMGRGFDNEGEACAAIDTLYLSRDSVGVDAPERPFALLVEGNSMSPSIEDGERIVVNPNITPGRGDVCLARIRSNGYLRDAVKFYFPRPGGGCVLKSSETSGIPPLEFTPQEVKDNDVVIVGRVVYIDTGRKI